MNGVDNVAQFVDCLPSVHGALGSLPTTVQKLVPSTHIESLTLERWKQQNPDFKLILLGYAELEANQGC